MLRSFLFSISLCALVALVRFPAQASIVDDWSSVQAPPPPAVQAVTVDPATTALLLLDFVKQTCGGPHCTAAVPAVAKMLAAARASHVTVIYSYTVASTLADTLPAVAPMGGEPSVQAGPDKFLNTDLQGILTRQGIKTVVVAGMSANGAVLYTASHAALAGFSVVVPVDTAPSESLYAEQFVIWNFANAPRVSAATKLTTTDLLKF
jgi:nicotinamidase-related amidase